MKNFRSYKSKRARTSAANVRRGMDTETLVMLRMRTAGLRSIEKMNPEFKVDHHTPSGQVVGKFNKNVSGDFHAIAEGGRAVHVEVKSTHGKDADRLIFSRIESHQLKAMNEKHAQGALVILAWARIGYGAKLMIWPIDGFVARTSLKWANDYEEIGRFAQ